MIKQKVLSIGVGVAVSALGVAQAQAQNNIDPFVESNGVLVVEVESEQASGDWSTERSIYGFSGDSYRVWRGINNFKKSEATRGDAVTYNFTITSPGTYEFRWRTRNTIGMDPTEHNDGWIRFSDGAENIDGEHWLDGWTKAFMGQVAQWSWDARTVDGQSKLIRQYFEAGDYTIDIAGRSNGHAADRFALYRYDTMDFDVARFDATPESPRQSEVALARHNQNAGSCYSNVLSIPATKASRVSGPWTTLMTDSVYIDDQANTLLYFDYPEDITGTATLEISSQQAAMDFSFYLASHDEWLDNATAADMPVAQSLMGSVTRDNAAERKTTIFIDDAMINSGSKTILFTGNSGQANNLHPIGSRLEPRLNIQVSSDYCDNYNFLRTGTGDLETNVPDSEEDDTDTDTDNSGVDGTDNDNTGNTNTDTDNTDGATEADKEPELATESDATGTDVIDASDAEKSADDTKSSTSGGAISWLGFLLLGVIGVRRNVGAKRFSKA